MSNDKVRILISAKELYKQQDMIFIGFQFQSDSCSFFSVQMFSKNDPIMQKVYWSS